MADNVGYTAGSGTTIATDDIAGVHFQKFKLFDGTADSTNGAVVDSSGNLSVKVTTSLPPGSNVIGGVTGSGNFTMVGSQAAGATITGNPVNVSRRAATANPTAVTNGQAVYPMADKLGRQVMVNGHVRDMCDSQATALTAASATTVVAAGGSNVFTDLTAMTLINSGSSLVSATLSDGTKSYVYPLAPNGGGVAKTWHTPRKATTANVAWTVTLSAVGTVSCDIDFVKNL